MAKKDAESVFAEVFTFFQANLNAKITEINTEKGDSLLSLFSNESWVQGGPDNKVVNFDQLVLVYVDSIQSEVNGPYATWKMTIEVDAVISKIDDSNNDYKRVLRLQRALKEVSENGWGKLTVGYDRPAITILSPVDIQLFNSSEYQKVIGVQIEINIS